MKLNIVKDLDLGWILIIIGLIIMVSGIPVEGLAPAATVSIDMPGGAGVSIEGIKSMSAITVGVGFIVFIVGAIMKYPTIKK